VWVGLAPRGVRTTGKPPLRLPAWPALQGSVPPGRVLVLPQSSGPHAKRLLLAWVSGRATCVVRACFNPTSVFIAALGDHLEPRQAGRMSTADSNVSLLRCDPLARIL
jgi:hypothetical protein